MPFPVHIMNYYIYLDPRKAEPEQPSGLRSALAAGVCQYFIYWQYLLAMPNGEN